MSRIIIAGDVHGSIDYTLHLIDGAARDGIDTILQVGDMMVLWPDYGEHLFTTALKQALAETGVRMIFIDGNHDNHPELRALPLNADGFGVITEHLLYVPRGHRWRMDGVRFGGLGGAFSINRATMVLGWDWFEGEEVVGDDVVRLGHAPLDVLLTHEVPAGIDVVSHMALPQAIEREAQRCRMIIGDAVRATKPKLVFSGHWHQRLTQVLPWSTSTVHVLDMEWRPGNAVVLDLARLEVKPYQRVDGVVRRTVR